MPVGLMGFDQKIRHQYNIITSIVCALKLFTFYTGDCYTDYATANLGAVTIVRHSLQLIVKNGSQL